MDEAKMHEIYLLARQVWDFVLRRIPPEVRI